MRQREAGDHRGQRPQAPQRDHQAGDEQQVVAAVEDVAEARLDEAQRGLVPARVQVHLARVAVELEGTRGALGRQEDQRGLHLLAQAPQAGLDREGGTVAGDRELELHVEQAFAPVQVQRVRQARPLQVRQCRSVVGKRTVRGQRHAGLQQLRFGQGAAVFPQHEVVGQPLPRGRSQRRLGLRQRQVARAAAREVDLLHRRQRHAHQQLQRVALRPDEGLHVHVVGHLVSPRLQRCDEQAQPQAGPVEEAR